MRCASEGQSARAAGIYSKNPEATRLQGRINRGTTLIIASLRTDDHSNRSSNKLLACNGATVTPYSVSLWGALLRKQTAHDLRHRLTATAGSLKHSDQGIIPSTHFSIIFCITCYHTVPILSSQIFRSWNIFYQQWPDGRAGVVFYIRI